MAKKTHSPVIWAVWGFFTAEILLFAFVGLRLFAGREFPTFSLLSTAALVCISLAVAQGLYILFGGAHFARRIPNYLPYSVTRWALAGSIGTYGLVLFMLGASSIVFCLFLAWAFLLQLYSMPRQRALEQFELWRKQALSNSGTASETQAAP